MDKVQELRLRELKESIYLKLIRISTKSAEKKRVKKASKV